MDFDVVRKAFAFSADERQTFAYIDSYCLKLERWLENNLPNEDIVKRFILVGFWLEYEATNHQGDDFSIDQVSIADYLERDRELHEIAINLNEKMIMTGFDATKPRKLYEKKFPMDKERSDIFLHYFRKPILSTEEYLAFVGHPQNVDLGTYLYEYVVEGKKGYPKRN